MCLSYSAARREDPGTAWQLAHTASQHTPDDPRATAWATARVGLYAARLGDREAAETAMQRSLEIGGNLPNPKPGDVTTPWMRFFDRASLLSSIAHTTAVLKGPRAAEYANVAVQALGPAKVKARAVVQAEATLAAASVGEHQLCLQYGSLAAWQPHSPATSTSASPPTSSTRSSTSSCPTPTPAPSENYYRN